MSKRDPEPTSDAARTDPDTADSNRDEMIKKAEQGLKKATKDLPKDPGKTERP